MPGTPLTPRDNTLILLYVTTRDDQGNLIPLTQANIENHVIMTDTSLDTDNDSGTPVENFESQAKSKGNVTWVGAISNVGNVENARKDFVIITEVVVNSTSPNKGLTNISRLPSNIPQQNIYGSYVEAKISSDPSSDDIEYTIGFNVWRWNDDGVQRHPESFTIDPRLKIH